MEEKKEGREIKGRRNERKVVSWGEGRKEGRQIEEGRKAGRVHTFLHSRTKVLPVFLPL
jgi:hypothetical protein